MDSYQAITISILVHIILLLLGHGEYILVEKEKSPPIEWIDLNEKQKEDPHTPLMGEKTQRVKKETRTKITTSSPMLNLGSNTPPPPPPNMQMAPQRETTKHHSLHKNSDALDPLRPHLDIDGLQVQQSQKKEEESSITPASSQTFMSSSPSPTTMQQLQSYMPRDLQIGDISALNTDQNLYYTFYRRMAEKIIWPWVQNVSAGFEKMKREGQLPPGEKAWTTIVELVLDKKGKVLSVSPMQLSGMWEIDSAPSKAFNAARNFPNPPVEMIEEDGYIRIRYRFVVYYNPRGGGY